MLGAPPAAVGAIEDLAEGAASVTKVAAGRLADRFACRPLIGAGYGLAALGKLLIALAAAWPLVLVARVTDRLGKGMRGVPRDVLLVDGVPNGQRGKVFGLHRAADAADAVVGPLVSLALYEALDHHLRPLFWIAVIPALASVALVTAVRDPRATARGATAPKSAGGPWRPLPSPYWRVLAMLTVFNLVNFPDALLLLRAHDLGLTTAGMVGAYAVYNLAYAALSYPAGTLSDRLPPPAGVRRRSGLLRHRLPRARPHPRPLAGVRGAAAVRRLQRLHRRRRQSLDLHPRPRPSPRQRPGPLPGRHRRRRPPRRNLGRPITRGPTVASSSHGCSVNDLANCCAQAVSC
ncbi:MFS transporter [Streptomyces sp. MK5]|uniref:MFS transporter n=1 Tax=Streptomyces sp. MK5 TaxID=3064253 RepID=UPI0027404218|nr:MFS transporter [Streptomyces sp. MK5]